MQSSTGTKSTHGGCEIARCAAMPTFSRRRGTWGWLLLTSTRRMRARQGQLKEIAVISDELLIIAPRHIYDAAMKVMTSVSAIVHASMPNPDSTTRNAAYEAAHRSFVGEYMGLERLIRKDLGVESPVEEVA